MTIADVEYWVQVEARVPTESGEGEPWVVAHRSPLSAELMEQLLVSVSPGLGCMAARYSCKHTLGALTHAMLAEVFEVAEAQAVRP